MEQAVLRRRAAGAVRLPARRRHRLLMWTDTLVRIPKITVRQDGKVIAKKTLPWPASLGRVFRVRSSVLAKAEMRGGPVTLSIDHSARPLNSALRERISHSVVTS